MTQEQFKRATEIMDKISDIEDNINIVREIKSKGNLSLLFASRRDISNDCVLINDILPTSVEKFIDLYLVDADKRLIELKQEFEKL